MIPIIDGVVHHFRSKGNYDGVTVLGDDETGSLWNHITGEAVYGPLLGRKLPGFNLLHTTVGQALKAHPELRVAISDRPIRGGRGMTTESDQSRRLGAGFRATIAKEDTRRPSLDIGLGLWKGDQGRYYPINTVRAQGNALLDEFEGRTVVVYVDPESYTLAALFVEASRVTRTGDAFTFDSGAVLKDGILRDAAGRRMAVERPMQLFTRWYGFALAFPGTTIYGN